MAAAAVKPYHLKLFFSNKYCRAQVLRVVDRHIVADACSWEKTIKAGLESTSDKVAAAKVGQFLAERAAGKEVLAVHWARKEGQKYHGKIQALIESMQSAGLSLH